MSSRVNVLLATYNGIEYLGVQLRSIESQSLSADRITIRDDGSTDGTQLLLQQWARDRSNVKLYQGSRLGTTQNFFSLLRDCEEDCEFFAFCDQDDVWFPQKIDWAIQRLTKDISQQPTMYCSRVEYVDEDLQHLGYSRIPRRLDLANALVENIATGCTIVLNRAAKDLICRNFPKRAMLHDWWCYLVVSALGKVIYDERPTVKYRQHAKNQVGANITLLQSLKGGLQRLFQQKLKDQSPSNQANEFLSCFGEQLSARNREIVSRFLSVRRGLLSRALYATDMDVRRQSRLGTLALRTMILLGKV
jgi:glycosyltransferase involved in cell wall biosynthesis